MWCPAARAAGSPMPARHPVRSQSRGAALGQRPSGGATPSRARTLSRSMLSTSAPRNDNAVALKLNYAELMGLQDVQLAQQPAVEEAYTALMEAPLEEGYSELARLGKEKLLFAAREGLREVRGRTSVLEKTLQIEPLLLPGAMALLHQLRRYELVVALSEEGAWLGAGELRSSSRDTIRDIERDMALATALAQCGLADRALREGRTAHGCARLAEALQLLAEASGASGGGGGGQGGQARPLAPALQSDIRAALADYHPDAVADYLKMPLERAEYELRAREVDALRRWVAAPAAALRRDQRPVLTPEYMAGVVPCLTSRELCGLYDWAGLAAGGPQRCPWYYPGLLKRAAMAHLVCGFAERRPPLLQIARRLFATIQQAGDDASGALPQLAMCELLLGDTLGALRHLEEDERAQRAQQAQQAQQARGKRGAAAAAAGADAAELAAAAVGGSWAKAGHRPGPERHEVMQFIRAHSPEGDLDLRPGLVAFGAWWLEAVAYPEFQDTALGAAPRPDLAAYFQDARVQAFLAQQDGKRSGGLMGALSNAQAALLARFGSAANAEAAADLGSSHAGSIDPLAEPAPLPRVGLRAALPWLASSGVLAAALLFGLQRSRTGSSGWAPWMPPVTAEAAQTAADIGLPPRALRPHYSAAEQQQAAAARSWLRWRAPGAADGQQQQQEQQQQQAAQAPAKRAKQQRQVAPISQQAATKLVQQWLVIKAEAMGPRHRVERLAEVLAEPMLDAVAQEAGEAAESGWFWKIRPLKCKVASMDSSAFGPSGSGHVVATAEVTESADLWASNGKQADSYSTTYQVEYMLVLSDGAWRIASALVLGK